MRLVQPCTEKSPLDRGDEQHQLAASQPGPAPRWPMLLAEHFQAHPRSASQPIEKANGKCHADRPQLQLSIKAGGAPTQSWTVRWSRKKVKHINVPPLYGVVQGGCRVGHPEIGSDRPTPCDPTAPPFLVCHKSVWRAMTY